MTEANKDTFVMLGIISTMCTYNGHLRISATIDSNIMTKEDGETFIKCLEAEFDNYFSLTV